jgi:hypothetical protein
MYPGEYAYPGVAATDQVINGSASSRHVVHVEVIKGQINLPRFFPLRLEPYYGDASFQQDDQISGSQVKEHPDHTVDPTLLDRTQAPLFFLRSATGVVHDQIVPMGFGRLLNAPLECRVKGISYVGNNARDREGLTRTKTARGAVGNVPEFVYGIQNPLPGLRWD